MEVANVVPGGCTDLTRVFSRGCDTTAQEQTLNGEDLPGNRYPDRMDGRDQQSGFHRMDPRIEHWTFSGADGSVTIRGMGDPRHVLGRAAEDAAARLLERSGLRIVD